MSELARALDAIVTVGPGVGGFAVHHLERGERWGHHEDLPLPTASVFKIPVMVEAFRQVAAGDIALTDRWELTDADKSTGSGVLVRLAPGLAPTVHDLITLMIIISDNTATDMLVRRLTPARITATMAGLGLTNTVVATTCRDLITGITPAGVGLLPYEAARIGKAHPADPASFAYAGTPNNNITTAAEMAALLGMIHSGEQLSDIGITPAAREQMLCVLLQQQLNDRIPRFLPGTVPIAHKTGSLGGAFAVRNDAGLIDLGERGTLAVSCFTCTPMPADADAAALNRFFTAIDCQMAEIAAAAHAHFTR